MLLVWWERLGVRRGKEEHVSLIWEEMRLGKRRGCKITCVVCDLPAEGTSDSYHPWSAQKRDLCTHLRI